MMILWMAFVISVPFAFAMNVNVNVNENGTKQHREYVIHNHVTSLRITTKT